MRYPAGMLSLKASESRDCPATKPDYLSRARLISLPAAALLCAGTVCGSSSGCETGRSAAEKDRLRQIKLDVVAKDDTDDELPMWQRRPYSTRWLLLACHVA